MHLQVCLQTLSSFDAAHDPVFFSGNWRGGFLNDVMLF